MKNYMAMFNEAMDVVHDLELKLERLWMLA